MTEMGFVMQILCITKKPEISSKKKNWLRVVGAKQIDQKTLVYGHQTLQNQTNFSRGRAIAEPQKPGLDFCAESTAKRPLS